MNMIWRYDETVRKLTFTELSNFAEGISLLRGCIGAVEEGFSRTGSGEVEIYNQIDARLNDSLLELPSLVLKMRTDLLESHCDELVSRAANILAERWLVENTPRYKYCDVQDLEYELVDAITEACRRCSTR